MDFLQRREAKEEEEEEAEKQAMVLQAMANHSFHFPQFPSPSPPPSSHLCEELLPHPDPRWGAQVFDTRRQRWPGTSECAAEAACLNDQADHGSSNVKLLDLIDSTSTADGEGEESSGGHGCEGGSSSEREHMFDKVVTPSDVGKLNRLVIPKQHAEKFFPLDSAANEKGLLLNFEDRSGKPWRFRYSYWNSSQSYVMTKGWSRFVKEKRLDAGDIVSFERGVGDSGKDRLYIDWRRRADSMAGMASLTPFSVQHPLSTLQRPFAWGRLFLPPSVSVPSPPHQDFPHLNLGHRSYGSGYGYNAVNPSAPVVYLRPQQVGGAALVGGEAEITASPMVIDAVPVVQNKAPGKRLRLFGVNMDCSASEGGEHRDDFSATVMGVCPHPQTAPALQWRSFHGTPPVQTQPLSEPSTKGKGSLSLDLDI